MFRFHSNYFTRLPSNFWPPSHPYSPYYSFVYTFILELWINMIGNRKKANFEIVFAENKISKIKKVKMQYFLIMLQIRNNTIMNVFRRYSLNVLPPLYVFNVLFNLYLFINFSLILLSNLFLFPCFSFEPSVHWERKLRGRAYLIILQLLTCTKPTTL